MHPAFSSWGVHKNVACSEGCAVWAVVGAAPDTGKARGIEAVEGRLLSFSHLANYKLLLSASGGSKVEAVLRQLRYASWVFGPESGGNTSLASIAATWSRTPCSG